MPTSLTTFKVIGLHGHKTATVPLRNNRLILIGENGTGKSTIANLIYYFLTNQWSRLLQYRFRAIEASLNGHEITVTAEQLEKHVRRISAEHLSPRQRLNLTRYLSEFPRSRLEEMISSDPSIRDFARAVGLPLAMARDTIFFALHERGEPSEIDKAAEQISSLVSEQFLYLPTYRRIEHDLQWIFRSGDVDIEELRKSLAGRGSEAYVELVHFGMEDVEQKFQTRMAQLKESLRAGLNKLTGSYLRDVIQGVHTRVNVADLKKVPLPVLDSIFTRISDETLPQSDKEFLKDRVKRIAEQGSFDLTRDTVIAHFLLKLFDLYNEQQEHEKNVREFVRVCNVYLSGKSLVYDNVKYEILIQVTDQGLSSPSDTLKLRMLSSGEKQIVSLFSHIYLSENRRFFVIIDEPELSLSVIWQRRFLPDILATERCEGLVAVTHSPFIWQNELEQDVRSLSELTVPDNVFLR